jgi:hypothetical protein
VTDILRSRSHCEVYDTFVRLEAERGWCPSLRDIAGDLHRSRTYVWLAINDLVSAGYLLRPVRKRWQVIEIVRTASGTPRMHHDRFVNNLLYVFRQLPKGGGNASRSN